jgi:hypothetical protein
VIDDNTELRPFREKLETKDLYWRLHQNV